MRTNRRGLLLGGAGLAGLAGFAATARKGRVKHSIALWIVNGTEWKWDLDRACRAALELGCRSVELVNPEDWPVLKKHGLACAIAPNGMPDPPFVKGVCNPRYHEEVIGRTRETIEKCAGFGVPNVIAFTGMRWIKAEDPKSGAISRQQGAANSVKALRTLAAAAEKHNVTVCLEMLSTRDDSHPMKGHPGYLGNDLDYCAEIVSQVNSPRVKLLFDIYHVQVMNGDVVRRIRKYADRIAHVHTAGCPGRGELDGPRQEIYFPGVIRALIETGYEGYVGQEFIPTRDPMQSLSAAVGLCDV